MSLTYFQKFINTFNPEKLRNLSIFQFLDRSNESIEEFEKSFTKALSGLSIANSKETCSQVRYSLSRKISEYQTGLEQIEFWLVKFGITYEELLNKVNNDLVTILNISEITDAKIVESLKSQHPYFENIIEEFYHFWSGWQISNAIAIVDNVEKRIFNSKISTVKPPFEPIYLGEGVAKNLIPTYFYNLLRDNKLTTSKVNIVRMLKFVFRDSEGNELSESTLNDIMNNSKNFSRSKKN